MTPALKKIKKAIEYRGIKITVLAVRIGVSRQHLEAVLRGKYPLSQKFKEKLEIFLDIK